MKWLAVLIVLFALAGTAHADGCSKSRDYLMEGLAGDLSASPAKYLELFKVCLGTLKLSNVKDAYVLKNGAIAIIPMRDTLIETAETLAQFCQRFPQYTPRFVSAREQRHAGTTGLIILLPAGGADSCKKIRGYS